MRSRNRSLVILICLFLISFKIAAGSVFIDAAIERAHMHQSSFSALISDHSRSVSDTDGGQQESRTLFLMSHVTANISENSIAVFLPPEATHIFAAANEVLFTQNFPYSAFKPPKAVA